MDKHEFETAEETALTWLRKPISHSVPVPRWLVTLAAVLVLVGIVSQTMGD